MINFIFALNNLFLPLIKGFFKFKTKNRKKSTKHYSMRDFVKRGSVQLKAHDPYLNICFLEDFALSFIISFLELSVRKPLVSVSILSALN